MALEKVDLSEQRCAACRAGTAPMAQPDVAEYLALIGPEWKSPDGGHIERLFRFANFREALEFVNAVGAEAERQGHHPDLEIGWGRVKVRLSTHKIKGLSKNDFILAAHIDKLAP